MSEGADQRPLDPRPRLAQLATDCLAAEHVASISVDPSAGALTIAQMAKEIEAQGKKRRLARAATVASLAAAFALAAGGAWTAWHRAPTASVAVASTAPDLTQVAKAAHTQATARAIEGVTVVVHDGREVTLAGDTPIAEGDRVIVREGGRASLRLPTGTRRGIEPGANVVMVHEGLLLAFALDAGSIRADVARLAADERFVVRTTDAEVEVRGTSFRVTAGAKDACAGTATRVDVDEGTVVVRSRGKEERVTAGGHWPASCGEASSAAPSPRRAPRRSRPLTAQEQSELKAQTRLFGEGIAAKKGGDPRAAADRFDVYLARYPDSALAEAAAAQRFEALALVDRAAAVEAARAYLSRWPGGFRRDEAAAIIAGGP